MKKCLILTFILGVSFFVTSNCHTAKKGTANNPIAAKPGYSANIKSIIEGRCSPCHIPEKGGNKKALSAYDSVKISIDEVIRRIELEPTDKGFMPMRHAKLSADTIAIFKQWREAAMPD